MLCKQHQEREEKTQRNTGGLGKGWTGSYRFMKESRVWVWEIYATDNEELYITKVFRHLQVSSNYHLTSEDLPDPLGILASLNTSSCTLAFTLTYRIIFPMRA